MPYKDKGNRVLNNKTDSNPQKQSDKYSKKINTNQFIVEDKRNYYLIPVFIVLCIIPLIVRLKYYNSHLSQFQWYGSSDLDMQGDLFLYYKQWVFIFAAAIMLLAVCAKYYFKRNTIRFLPVFIPLAIYAIYALLSAILSKYASFSFSGSFELFESVFVLLGYCILVYYVYLFVNTEKDFRLILSFIIGLALIMSVIGVLQFLGYDIFTSGIGHNLMIPTKYRSSGLSMNFPKGDVYLTLYNPNYVSVYVALVLPIILVTMFFQRKLLWITLSALSVIGLLVCAVGSRSLGGVLGLGAAAVLILVFMRHYIAKKYYIAVPVIIVLLLGLVLLNSSTDNLLVNKFKIALNIQKTEPALSELITEKDGVSVIYNGNNMKVQYIKDENGVMLLASDSEGQMIPYTFDQAAGIYTITDERFPGFYLGFESEDARVFYIMIEDKRWRFTNFTTDGTYYYVTLFGRLDKIVKAPSAFFSGYEKFASNRGYIWSRTIPMLKDYLFLGSGPDTFTMAFPQQDYLGLYQAGMETAVLTKPHNMYLQTGVQTGVLSLIAFLVFYLMYAVSSIKLFIRGRFSSFYEKFGVAVFIGTVSYMVTGLANDSNINTAPLFWALMGVGIAVNSKAKSLIMEEIAEAKARKAEKENAAGEKKAAE